MNEPTHSRDPQIPARATVTQDSLSAAESSEVTRESPGGVPVVRVPSAAGTTSRSAFGRYEVRRSLGAGGFGEVYLGHDTQLDRSVAIKVLRASFAPALTAAAPALQEARKLAHLRHSGIVAVHDIGVHQGQVYVVTDFVDGPNLHHWLRDNHPPWAEAARIVAAIADALSHAHTRRIVHRDIKPSNIILTADRAPVLVDFGLALGEEQAGGARGRVSGTPSYMSPEQVHGTAHRIDGRTDVYSLGVVLYELLTGRVPFSAATVPELMRQVCDDAPQPPRQLVRDIPPELERACLKALAKRQEDRYTTAADFAEDLRRVPMTAAASPGSGPMPIEAPAGARPPPVTTPASDRTDGVTPTRRRSLRDAERRHLTVLVAGSDVFESDAYLQLDSEDQARVLQVFQDCCNEAVSQFGGTVVQFTDKGLVACFGFPAAYEDAAARAARAGLATVETIKRARTQFGLHDTLSLQPWVGIHTGAVVVESKEDAVSLVGDARNVAVRLGDVALAGEVICTNDSQRLLRGQVACVSLGQHKIKSATHPVELFRIEPIALTGNPMDAVAPAELSPLIGRDREMGLLTDRWEQAREGMGQIVLLIGEAGLGKSRLVHTMKQHVLGLMKQGDVDEPVIEWRCSPHYQNTGFHPAIDYYERALRFRPEEPPQDRIDRMLQGLEQYGLVRPETAPLWASLLSLPTPDRFPPLSLSPVRQREETFRAMLEWLHTRAARKPILFIVEDLHWVDASTLEFLGQFLAEGLHDSILTLLTFRPEFKTPWPAVAHQTSLALNRLTRRQVGDLMTNKVKRVLPDAVVQQVYARAGGVPLFVEEFTRMVQESGMEDHEGGRGAMVPGHAIPATLQDLMMSRLDRMEGEREVAQLASVLGREVAYEVLAAITTLDEPTLQIELAKLVQEEILYPKGRPPRCSYIFKHALLEDALYNTLVTAKRQQFHRQIAEVLEAQFPQTTDKRPELVAHHFSEGGLAEASVAYWLKAGLRGLERSANVEAIGHLTKGLSIVRALPESPERDAQELQFLNPLGTSYMAARGYAAPEVEPVFRRASELCERLGDPIQQVAIMRGVAGWHLMHCDFKVCTDFAAYAMELAEEFNAPEFMMVALTFLGVVALYRGDFTGARQYSARAVSEYDDPERTHIWPSSTGEDCGLPCRNYLALSLWHSGYPDQALQLSRLTIALARTIGHPFSLAYALSHAGSLLESCQLGEEAQAAGEEQITIATEQGFALWHATGTLCRGGGLVSQANLDGLPLLVEGIERYRASGAELGLSEYLRQLGDAYTRAGQFQQALTAINDGLSFAQKNDERFQEAELHRLRGELHLAESDDHSAAEACFHTAIETARRQQSRAWELRATTSLARLWQRQARAGEARDALAAVYESYTEGFTTPDLVDARALLEGRATERAPTRARGGPVDAEPRSEAQPRIEDPRVDQRVEGPRVGERGEGARFAERVESALLGESAAVSALRAAISREAAGRGLLLLTGPPGAGHEAVARALHDASGRSGPFISVSCPEFRTEPRATLARGASPDLRLATRLAEAAGGTLFLDAVHELPSQLRPALQRWLARESMAPDVRVIASTTRDLVRDAQSGALDPVMGMLLHNRITIPALVDRREDIPLLVDHYVRIHAQQQGKPVDGVSSASLTRLEAHVWPGNLRELCDVLERAVLRARSPVLDIDDALLEESVAVGNYRLIELLGAGGMGEVWLARHRLLARPAAVKLVRHDAQGGAAQEELAHRFQREARVTAGLRSPHTVQLYDFGVSERGSFYYVMELLVGLDLHRIVSRFGPQPAERVIMLLRQACRSLADAHGHGLVHRDIKPANLFVTQLGWEYDYLKVLDFGMVTDRPGQNATVLSSQGIVRGTPAFMAPEQVLGDSRLDGRADLYSLACTAYWALTGRLPFEAGTPMQMLLHHAQTAPLPPSQVSELPIPRPLEILLMKCLSKRPAERSASALDFDAELARVRCEQPWTDDRAREWWATHAPDIMAAHQQVRDEQ